MSDDILKKFGFRPKSRREASKKTLRKRFLSKGPRALRDSNWNDISKKEVHRLMDIRVAKDAYRSVPSGRKRSIKSGTFNRGGRKL